MRETEFFQSGLLVLCVCTAMACDDSAQSEGETMSVSPPGSTQRDAGLLDRPAEEPIPTEEEAEADAEVVAPMLEDESEVCTPVLEACNDLDDDCDGKVDEDAREVGDDCIMDLPGACNIGALVCGNGTLNCIQAITPEPEVCDEADNDCDGATDELLGGEVCDTGDRGICAVGTRVCSLGAMVCEPDLEPRDEMCNGVDDDCNGEIDDMPLDFVCGCDEGRPNLNVQGACGGGGYQPYHHVGECAADTELHIVGQYTSANGEFTEVVVDRVGVALVLVLSSYDPTTWRVRPSPGAVIEQIIISGYEPSGIEGALEGVEVSNLSGQGAGSFTACGYRWPDDDQGCDTPALVRGAQARTRLEITSFQGCYSGAGFRIDDAPNRR